MNTSAATRQRLSDAITSGELLVAIYHGGHAPGSKRRIQPLKLTADLVYARDGTAGIVKTFSLHKLELCSEDNPAPWIGGVTRRRLGVKINPETHFAGWAFEMVAHCGIPDSRHFWAAMGITLREYVDKEQTKAAKKAAAERGEPPHQISRIKIRHMAWAMAPAPDLDFHEGDLFHSTRGEAPIQVVVIRDFLEVHRLLTSQTQPRQAYHVVGPELVEWLRSGNAPAHAQIGPDLSYSDIFRFQIEQATPPIPDSF